MNNISAVNGFPHTFRVLTVSGVYRRLAFATLIPVGFGVARGGVSALLTVVAAVLGTVLADIVMTRGRSDSLHPGDGRALYIGLAMAGLLPAGISPVTVMIAGVLTLLVGVWLFGGPGKYRIHPALVGPALLGIAFLGPTAVGEGAAFLSLTVPADVISLVERTLFEPIGVRVSPEAWRLLLGGIGPEGGSLVLGLAGPVLVGSLIVFGEDLLPAILPATFLAVYSLGTWTFGALPGDWFSGAPLDALLLTNAPFVIVFLTADPSVRPATATGMVLFGVLAGGLATVFRVSGTVVAPATIAVFIAGAFVPVLDGLTTRRL